MGTGLWLPPDQAGAHRPLLSARPHRSSEPGPASAPGVALGVAARRAVVRARQLVLVTTAGWELSQGELRRLVRDATGWRPLGPAVPVALGAGGLGWGRGLHDPALAARHGGPMKVEGDRRAPAGIFSLPRLMGAAPRPLSSDGLPFARITSDLRCVDDPLALDYNRVVRAPATGPGPWSSAETMLRTDDLYRWVVVVGHNMDPVRPGAGSCVFLHAADRALSPTLGCTALAPPALEELVRWLRREDHPLLVQLPRAVYPAVAAALGLPTGPGSDG